MAKAKIRADLRVKFEGQPKQVDAQTFINSLTNLSVIVQEINLDISPDSRVDIKIVALEEGSFIAGISLSEVTGAISGLFSKENVEYAAGVVSVLGGVFALKKFLGKDEPKSVIAEGDGLKIENNKGSIQYIDNRTYGIYSRNQTVSDALSNSFTTLEDDPSVTGFELLDGQEKTIFEAKREEFIKLALKSEVIQADRKSTVTTANLNVLKIVLEKGRKWEFYYAGNKISADIVDDTFFDRVTRGEERFANGDVLKVELETVKIFDEAVNIYVNHSYHITRVIEHVPRNEQMRLEDLGDDVF